MSYQPSFKQDQMPPQLAENIGKLLDKWIIQDIVNNRKSQKSQEKHTQAPEFADIDATIAHFKNQSPIRPLFQRQIARSYSREEFFEPCKNIRKRSFSTAFGEEKINTISIGVLYPAPIWHSKIYPSDESDDQSSNEDDNELHTPV